MSVLPVQKDKYIEEWFPLTLSNGVTLRLKSNGYWDVSICDANISLVSKDLIIDGIIEVKVGEDYIEKAFDVICRM